MTKIADKILKSSVFIIVLLSVMQCAINPPTPDLPDDVLGIKLGMNRDDAENRLREIGDFKEDARKRQQVWLVRNVSHFDSLAIGYNQDNKVRYITAFADKDIVKEPLRFSEVGDLSKAKQEITAPHHRYTWTVEAADGKPAHIVSIYGTDPEFVSMYSLAEAGNSEKKKN